jgi:hypothetical protein
MSTITYRRTESGYVARVAGRAIRVRRQDWHMIPSHAFDWLAEFAGVKASGATREEAVRTLADRLDRQAAERAARAAARAERAEAERH